jgi:hypothetical protein
MLIRPAGGVIFPRTDFEPHHATEKEQRAQNDNHNSA